VQLGNDDATDVASGWKLNFYDTGTTTRKDTFSDNELTTANANPVVADSSGRWSDIFLESGTYKVVLTDADDTEKWTADPVTGGIGSSGTVDEKTASYTITVDDGTKVIAVDATSAAVTITLLASATAGDGFEITVLKSDSSANAVTVDGNASETISGSATRVLSGQWESATVRGDATNWLLRADSLPDMTQAQAEAGTDTARRAVTAQRLAQAVEAIGHTSWQPRGLITSNDTDTDHDINITAGAVRDATNAVSMVLSSEITKQIDAAWAVGDDAGGMDTGAVAQDTLYAVWLIKRSDTGVVDALFSTSFTSPTMPTSYDYKRLIGAVTTEDAAANIIGFTQVGDYFRYTGDVISDVSDATITSDSYETGTLSVPPSSLAHIYAESSNATTTNADARVFIRTKDAADDAAIDNEAFFRVGGDAGTDVLYASGIGTVLVNSSSQIEYAAFEGSGATTVTVKTLGFTMLTRRDP
jgi:hypothetical protein